MRVLRGFPAENIVACFDEAAGGGDWRDINAPRNAPALNPAAYLGSIVWHSDLFPYELALPPQVVTVNHPQINPASSSIGITWSTSGYSTTAYGVGYTVVGDEVATEYTLVNHGLPYVPVCMVAHGGAVVSAGTVIQLATGRGRSVTPFATSSIIGLREMGVSSNVALAAVSETYTVLVFRNPAAEPGKALFSWDGSELVFARGKISSLKRYLRRTGPGDSPFSIDLGPTIDYANGGTRSVTGGIVMSEPSYNGSFAGPAYQQVGV